MANSKAAGPEQVIESYREALASGAHDKAYSLMSTDFQATVTLDQFKKLIEQNKQLVDETQALLKRPKDVTVSAEYDYGLGDRLRFVRSGGVWKLVSNPIDYYGAETPRRALRSFVRAFKHQRWDVMLEFVPRRYREQTTAKQIETQFSGVGAEDLVEKMKLLEENLSEPIIENVDTAQMSYGDLYQVVLVREVGKWKIKDLD